MNRDHQIRIAVRGLKGEERSLAILKLLQNPRKVREVSFRPRWSREKYLKSRRKVKNNLLLTLTVRLTPDDYISLRNRAGGRGKISNFVRERIKDVG